MYDIFEHLRTVLRVIRKHNIPLRVMLGVEPLGEISNPNCRLGGLHTDEDIVLAVSVGNENTASWHPNKIDLHVLADHVRYLKSKTNVPVSFFRVSVL